ncbi:MAG: hypothetical protein KGJ98_02875 [Chloroflexota bacterium]|nr:hypothetical protein [Chloroflexota bacterium]MDE3101160.1 hypothetical protein [Chloroflexota bacterium]
MDLAKAFSSDVAILLFSAAGLVATTVAILRDTQTHAADAAKEPIGVGSLGPAKPDPRSAT